jgi:hypothetical protein
MFEHFSGPPVGQPGPTGVGVEVSEGRGDIRDLPCYLNPDSEHLVLLARDLRRAPPTVDALDALDASPGSSRTGGSGPSGIEASGLLHQIE